MSSYTRYIESLLHTGADIEPTILNAYSAANLICLAKGVELNESLAAYIDNMPSADYWHLYDKLLPFAVQAVESVVHN